MGAVRDEVQREDGFTLLELLIAMSLLSMLALLLFGGLRFGARVWERTGREGTSFENLLLVQDWVRRELSRSYPAPDLAKSSRFLVQFVGTSDQIGFLGPAARSLNLPGRAWIRLYSITGNGGIALFADETPELGVQGAHRVHEQLLSGLSSLTFSYFGSLRPDGAPAWQPVWKNQSQLPQLIRITAAFTDPHRRFWPALVIAPRINSDNSCIYDPLSHSCRGRPL